MAERPLFFHDFYLPPTFPAFCVTIFFKLCDVFLSTNVRLVGGLFSTPIVLLFAGRRWNLLATLKLYRRSFVFFFFSPLGRG